jgi:rhodanese-related sulfurtransferase
MVSTIRPEELKKLQDQGTNVDLIDVRTPAEFREVHATIARNVPLDQLNAEKLREQRNGSADAPLYVICRSGSRAGKACEQLLKSGFAKVVNVEGGTVAWEQAGLPVVRGKKTISLERQVRIAAGFLVLLGVALSYLHPAFLGISAFVGAGLMFAGITDTCGMAMMLARMPWNKVSGGSPTSCSVSS